MYRALLLTTLCLVLNSSAAFSTERTVHYIGIEHGLSNNNVTRIYQDRQGFMWFGTFDGLNRYDGYTFKTYKNHPSQPSSLPDNRITDIIQDREGYMWIASKIGAALLKENDTDFSHLLLKTDNSSTTVPIDFAINQFVLWKDEQLFAASEQKGLLAITKVADEVQAIPVPLAIDQQEIIDYNAHTVAVDKENTLWIMVHHYGLCYYDPKENNIKVKNNQVQAGTHMAISDDGDIWIATNDRGVYRYKKSRNQYSHYATTNGLSSNTIASLYYNNNKMWVCTDGGGITIINTLNDTMEYISSQRQNNLLKSQTVYAIYRDNMSRVWIGTLRGGINVLDPNRGRFKSIRPNPLPDGNSMQNFILSFAEGNNNDLWIGSDGGGLLRWDRQSNRFESYGNNTTNPAGNFVSSIVQDRKGRVWVGTYGNGISALIPRTGKTKVYRCINPNSGYIHANVWKIIEDSRGRIWASTLNGGKMYLYDEEEDSFSPIKADIHDVLTIFEEDAHTFWFGSWATLSRLDLHTGEKQEISVGTPVRAIHAGKGNTLWVATEGGGLLKLDKKNHTFQRFTETEGLPSNTVLNILEDNSGNLWLSTYNGLSRFDTDTESFQNYYESDGLQSNQFSYNAAIQLSSGEMVFGGIKGFNIFHPDSLKRTVTQPPIVLTAFHINNTSLDQYGPASGARLSDLSTLRIMYSDAAFSFGFAALEYSFPDKIQYAYFLDGWDKSWNYVNSDRTARYSGLREGKYTLRIKSTNADGTWNPEERTIQIEVLPPWWRTGWAYTVYLLFALGIVSLVVRYDRRQTKLRYKVKLAEINTQKEKELNEKKIAFFTHIAHEFRNPLTLIVNPIKDMIHRESQVIEPQELTPVYNNTKRLLSLVDKLLLFRTAENDFDNLRLVKLDLNKLCYEVFLCFKQHASSHKIDYSYICDVQDMKVLADREKLEICLFNLISNAIKFTPQHGKVTVHIEKSGSHIRIHVNDTGCGINPDVGERIFKVFHRDYNTNNRNKEGFGIGLFLVKKIAEAHKGTISYRSNNTEGTYFTLSLLTGEQHFKGSLVFEDIDEHSVFVDELLNDIETDPHILPSPQADQEVVPQEGLKERQKITDVATDRKHMLIVDDNEDIRKYLCRLFEQDYTIEEATSAEEALAYVEKSEPNIILSDIVMTGMSGIDLCSSIKNNPLLNHIPIILLTASSSQEVKLKGLEGGADDYVTKPFDKDILIARVSNLIQSRNRLQDYFYNEITLQKNDYKISSEYKDFLEKAINIVENYLDDPNFNVKILAEEIGMSHSNMYKRIKSISGKSANEFIRFVRLRKVAQLLIDTDCNINQAAFAAGFNDIKYFRVQFQKLFRMNPSEYKKRYQILKQKHHLNIR